MRSEGGPTQDQVLSETIAKIVSHVGAVYNALLTRDPEVAELQKYANAILQGMSPMDFFHAIDTCEERKSRVKVFALPGHFYSPIANPAELHHYVRRLASIGPELAGISIDREALIATWESLLPYLTTCRFPEQATPGFYYYSDNYFYGFADAAVLQAMLRRHRPKRYIEIGSGFSSACAIDTIDQFLNGSCEVTFVEPNPDRLRKALGERLSGTRILTMPVQAVPLATFEQLEAGDILFIDSSHVLRTGSDVCFELFEILPRLAPGVLVHFHDVNWPFEYPPFFILEENRSWNEAYALRAFLIDNDSWKVVFFSDYFAKFEAARVEQSFPGNGGSFGASLWLQRC